MLRAHVVCVHGLQLPGRYHAREYRSGWKYFRLPSQLLSAPTHFNVRSSVFWSGGAPPPSCDATAAAGMARVLASARPIRSNCVKIARCVGRRAWVLLSNLKHFNIRASAHATRSRYAECSRGGNKIKFARMYYRAAGSRKVHTTSTCRLFPAVALCVFNALVVLDTRHSSADAPAERYPGPAQPVDRVVGAEDVSDAVSTDAEVRSEEGDWAG